MPAPLDICLDNLVEAEPVPRFVKMILCEAVVDKADEIVFALDLQLEDKFKAEKEQLFQQGKIDEAFLQNSPNTFSITLKSGGSQQNVIPCTGDLFEPFMRILLNAAEIPYWTKNRVSFEFETIHPASKWKFVSENLKSTAHLERIDDFRDIG
jgi:hypothetical protein